MSARPAWYLRLLALTGGALGGSFKATNLPVIGKLIERMILPLFTGKNFNVTYIPINETVSRGKSTVLPQQVLEELMRRSSYHVIIDRCTCRDVHKCKEHPITLGCTFLGEGARDIDPRIARHVSVEEAIDHAKKTFEEGLIPLIGRVKIDDYIWGVRDRGKLLTVCHCCRCCCVFLTSGRVMPDEAASSLVRLQGLRVMTDPEMCTCCGTCVEECFVGAISMNGEKTVLDEALCKGCGRCVTSCPESAIRMEIEDMNAAIDELNTRIDGLIDIR